MSYIGSLRIPLWYFHFIFIGCFRVYSIHTLIYHTLPLRNIIKISSNINTTSHIISIKLHVYHESLTTVNFQFHLLMNKDGQVKE